MKPNDTSMGGLPRSFPTTIWSDILAAGDVASPRHREALERLVPTYWKPVYAYIRLAWHKSVDDSKDFTQEFFSRFLEAGYLSRLRPERGSFRAYLKRALRHFLVDSKRAEEARRPVTPVFHLDAGPGELERLGLAAPGETPERAYDREWFRCLFHASVEALKQTLDREGKAVYVEVFKSYCLDPLQADDQAPRSTVIRGEPPAAPTYREIATRLGLRETDVVNYLHHCRTVLRQIVKEQIRNYVATEEEAEQEFLEFVGR